MHQCPNRKELVLIQAAPGCFSGVLPVCHCSVSSGCCFCQGTKSVLWARGNVPGTAGILQLELGLGSALHVVPSALLQVRKCWPDWIYYYYIYGFLLPHFKSSVLCPKREAQSPAPIPLTQPRTNLKLKGKCSIKRCPTLRKFPA